MSPVYSLRSNGTAIETQSLSPRLSAVLRIRKATLEAKRRVDEIHPMAHFPHYYLNGSVNPGLSIEPNEALIWVNMTPPNSPVQLTPHIIAQSSHLPRGDCKYLLMRLCGLSRMFHCHAQVTKTETESANRVVIGVPISVYFAAPLMSTGILSMTRKSRKR